MRLAFLGTSDFAVPTLDSLCDAGHEVALVLCQPDRPAGRGRQLQPGPAKRLALSKGLPIFQPQVLDDAALERLSRLEMRAAVVVSYGLILPAALLRLPPLGCINLHGSLLPKYRGASPVAHAILRGETVTGVTTLLMNEGIDTGPLLLQKATPIGEEESAGELEARLAVTGAGLVLETLEKLSAGELTPRSQIVDRQTYAPKIAVSSGRILWSLPAAGIARQVRAYNPRPGAFTRHRGRILKIWRARTAPPSGGVEPGIVIAGGGTLQVACGESSVLELLEVQLEGRRRVSGEELLRGRLIASGDRFDDGEAWQDEGPA
ncbi:MAG TPA: methionyl-tRNA formyltransferase [Candidatus Polarisedimenticolia bacterium]|nr:methionyl-tRNA formyltransferase [Candidatus Polarisedimenticolia bacterium]